MATWKFALRVCVLTTFFTFLAGPGVHAVEPWSTDLWKESTPSVNESNTGSQQKGSSSGGGLWSDQLWQNTQPGQSVTPPVQDPKPADKPLPVNNPDKTSYILIMQVENNKALVRGAEKELFVPPTIINGRMMIPLHFIGEALNAAFSLSYTERKTTLELDGKKIEIWTGKSTAMVNGNAVQLDTPPVVLDGSTLVPIRFVSDNFGYVVEYKAETQTIKIKEPEKKEPKPEQEVKKPVINSNFNYFGVWSLRMDGFSGGLPLGTLLVYEDGTYEIKHGINGTAIGKWRQGAQNEVIGYKDMLILENGPAGMDWVMIPKTDGIVSVRYHYGYDIQNKIWFEDCLGIKTEK